MLSRIAFTAIFNDTRFQAQQLYVHVTQPVCEFTLTPRPGNPLALVLIPFIVSPLFSFSSSTIKPYSLLVLNEYLRRKILISEEMMIEKGQLLHMLREQRDS